MLAGIRLSGTFDDKGATGSAGVVASVLSVPLAGFFVTGTSANIPAGAGIKAFLDEDLRIAVPQPAPLPMPVTVPVVIPVQAAAPGAGAVAKS